ncbi:MAG: RNA chaperone Hfq [Deltaproteobacteria bacterium]|nr:RNA chaperone Hfq [Candidatus Zymogenaceae bacterium]
MKNSINIQDQFLNQMRKEKIPVIINLTGNTQLEGTVKSFDNFCIMLESDKEYLIYKHAITTIHQK